MKGSKLLLMFALGLIAGSVVTYAVTQIVIMVTIVPSKPAAVADIKELRLEAAPYQTVDYRMRYVGSITQLSDRVRYEVTAGVVNLKSWELAVHVCSTPFPASSKDVVATAILSEGITKFTFELNGTGKTYYVFIDIKGKTTNKEATIKVIITPKPIP